MNLTARRHLLSRHCCLFIAGLVYWYGVTAPNAWAQKEFEVYKLFPGTQGAWAETVLSRMSLEEKIGQLFMVQAYSTNDQRYNAAVIEAFIKRYKIGGIIFMQGGPQRQAELANKFQQLSELPLLVGQDLEYGLRMRLDSTQHFPFNIALGAVQNDSLLFQYGQVMAEQCRAVGVHVNFAPVVDVNNNPRNPVINERSFGENKYNVMRKALMYMKGLQSGPQALRVIANAKHFPGHGDTDVDSHDDLPHINHTRARLDSLELYPFRELIRGGVQSLMVAHLMVPALDTTGNQPTSLSARVIKQLLRDTLNFNGLVFTDALMMKGVTKYYPSGRTELQALLAGNDVFLMPENVPLGIEYIKQAVFERRITERELDTHVRRVLLAKEWLGLHKNRLVNLKKVQEVVNSERLKQLRRRLYAEAVTLVRNHRNLLPINNLPQERIAYVQVGYTEVQPFGQALRSYAPIDVLILPADPTQEQTDSVRVRLQNYTTIVVGLLKMRRASSRMFGLGPNLQDFLCMLSRTPAHLVVAAFGNPYAVSLLPPTVSVIVAYDDSEDPQSLAAQLVFGGAVPKGRLAVTVPDRVFDHPHYDATAARFGYERPSTMGMKPEVLDQIDSIANSYIKRKAMPGCAVLVMRGNKIVFHRGYGYTDYDKTERVDPYTTLYDLASVTKVTATLLAAMRLQEEGKLDLEASIATYLPQFKGTPKEAIRVRNLLQHDAGLPAFIPFYKNMVDSMLGPQSQYFSRAESDAYPVPIGAGYYARKDIPDWVWRQIEACELTGKPGDKVVYSDLGMIILARMCERILGTRLEFYLQRTFYKPLGMGSTYFTPGMKCLSLQIAPTEDEKYFRFGRVQGYVHDPTAALLGGYAGHAGLFSNVYDVAKLLLMLKNGGTYAGQEFLKKETIDLFTAQQVAGRRRGLGWDKPETDAAKVSPASKYASPKAYGHLGFTGTCVWVDPQYDLIYVFLSNRTFPDSNNKLFGEESVRIKVMDAIYQSMLPQTKTGKNK